MTSASLTNPDYWWYRARDRIFDTVFRAHVTPPVLDVGSADGPSVSWIGESTTVDIDPAANPDIVASVTDMPVADNSYATVGVFDVLEHVDDEAALEEIRRVLKPGGKLLVSVPAYNWAWSGFDVRAGHLRRYTKRQLIGVLERGGFEVVRASYVFAATFPFFIIDRATSKVGLRGEERPGDSQLPSTVSSLLEWLAELDRRLIEHVALPFGSSIVAVSRLRTTPLAQR